MNITKSEVMTFVDDGLLASHEGKLPRSIAVSLATVPPGGAAGDMLPRGLVLTLVTDDQDPDYGLYREYVNGATNGQGDESNAVVLKHRIDPADFENTDRAVAPAYITGTFKREKIIVGPGFDWSKAQRLIRWPAND